MWAGFRPVPGPCCLLPFRSLCGGSPWYDVLHPRCGVRIERRRQPRQHARGAAAQDQVPEGHAILRRPDYPGLVSQPCHAPGGRQRVAAIAESIDQALTDAKQGRRLRGASTITQQVAKNVFLWKGQSWLRKGLEAWFTVLIEALWPKQRIIEVYLNSAEFGRGTWGVEAASRRFFGKPAGQLNRSEAALLAAVLPNPKRFRVEAGRIGLL